MHRIMLKLTINDFIHIDAAGGGNSGFLARFVKTEKTTLKKNKICKIF